MKGRNRVVREAVRQFWPPPPQQLSSQGQQHRHRIRRSLSTTGFYQRSGGFLSGQRGGPNKNRPPLRIAGEPSASASTPELQQTQPQIQQNHENPESTHPSPPPQPVGATATAVTMTSSAPPHIFEMAPSELSLYAADLTTLETFADQLIEMARLNRMTYQLDRLASLVANLLSLLNQQRYGLRGSVKADSLIRAVRATIGQGSEPAEPAAAAAAGTGTGTAPMQSPPPQQSQPDALTTTMATVDDMINEAISAMDTSRPSSLPSSSSSPKTFASDKTTHHVAVSDTPGGYQWYPQQPLHLASSNPAAAAAAALEESSSRHNNTNNGMRSLADVIATATWQKQPLHIFQVSHDEMREYADAHLLETFVRQVEEAAAAASEENQLNSALVEKHILPLSRSTAIKFHGVQGARWTERLLHAVRRSSQASLARHRDDPNQIILPVPAVLYTRCLIAWGYCNRADERHDRVRHIFRLLREDETCRTDRTHYKSYLRVLAQFDPPTAHHVLKYEMEPAAGVPALLGELSADINAVPSVPSIALPDVAVYNIVALAYAKAPPNRQHVMKLWRAVELMDRVKKLHAVTNAHPLDGHSYLALITAYRQLLRMTPPTTKPATDHNDNSVAATTTITYTPTTARPTTPPTTTPPTTVEDITNRMERLFYDEIHPRIREHEQAAMQQPPTTTAKMTQQKRTLDGHDFTDRDEDAVLFPLSMSWAYETLIEAYVKTHQTDRAIRLLECMLHGTQGVYRTNPRNSTLMMLAPHLSDEQRNKILERCVLTRKYARVYYLHDDMESWASLPHPQPPYVAELVESMLLHAFVHFRSSKSKPNSLTFRIAIKAWLRCRDQVLALTRIDSLMAEMINVGKYDNWYTVREVHVRLWMTAYLDRCPTGQRYTIAGTSLYPAEHCERILRLVRPLFKRLNIVASQVAIAIRAWSMQEGADIDDMERLQRVDDLINSIKADEIPAYPTNYVLTTCCRDFTTVEAQQRAYKIASSLFIRKDVQLNSRSFDLMMDVVYKIRKDETLVIELFRRACTAGLVNQNLVWQVCRVALDPEDLQKLFHLDHRVAAMIIEQREDFVKGHPLPRELLLENLPKEWRANCDRTKKNEPGRKNDDDDDHDDDHGGNQDGDQDGDHSGDYGGDTDDTHPEKEQTL